MAHGPPTAFRQGVVPRSPPDSKKSWQAFKVRISILSHTNKATSQRKMAAQPVAEVLTFPTDPAEFENDDRISFSKLDHKYIAVQESDGTEFEFDVQLKRWIPLADEDEEALILQQQSAYLSAAPTSESHSRNGRKRKQDDLEVSCARWSA